MFKHQIFLTLTFILYFWIYSFFFYFIRPSLLLTPTRFIFKTLSFSLSLVEIAYLQVRLDSPEMLMIQGFGCLIPQSQPSASPPHPISMLICLIWTALSLWICHGWMGVGELAMFGVHLY